MCYLDSMNSMNSSDSTNSTNSKRNRGGQPGNQNARKNDFYWKVLDGNRRRALKRAAEVQGLDQEIALLRLKIQSLLETDPSNLKLIGRDARTLAMLVSAKNKIPPEDKNEVLRQAVKDFLQTIPFPASMTGSRPGSDTGSSSQAAPD